VLAVPFARRRYKEELPALFFESVGRLLAPGGQLLLCHVPRANVTHEVVVSAAERQGFAVERVDKFTWGEEGGEGEDTLPDGCPMEDAARARIYRVMRK
jgi:hypothetical protein